MKSKLTLVIDGNWLLMSRLAVLIGKYSDIKELNKNLNILLIKSIKSAIRTFPQIDNVIFVADGGSWRNDIKIPTFLEKQNISYKGNREHNEDIDIDAVFANYNTFIETLKNNNITVCYKKNIEGDDWCGYLSRKLNEDLTNVIIWSKDKDLTQLVKTDDKTGFFTVCWDKKSGIIIEDKPNDDIDDVNILFQLFMNNVDYSSNLTLLNNICNKCSEVNRINPTSIIMDKIIRGDSGDNILPILYKNSNSKRLFKVSPKDIINIDYNNDDEVKQFITDLCSKKQYIDRKDNKPIEDIIEHFYYNRNLVVINTDKYYPTNIKENLKIEDIKINKDFSMIEQQILANDNNLVDILENL